jgi:hypothetical protein
MIAGAISSLLRQPFWNNIPRQALCAVKELTDVSGDTHFGDRMTDFLIFQKALLG